MKKVVACMEYNCIFAVSVVACEGFNGKQNESIAIERIWHYVYYTVGILRNKLNYILDVKSG